MEKYQKLWIDTAKALFRDLVPVETRSTFSHTTQQEHASLVDREEERVDKALADMAVSAGEKDTRQIASALSMDTVIALASRWAHHMASWQSRGFLPWLAQLRPPKNADTWRAILLAMMQDREAAIVAAKHLWGEDFLGSEDQ